jgi:hypothetical protein
MSRDDHQQDREPSAAIPPDPLVDEVRAIRARLSESAGHDVRVLAERAREAARRSSAPVIPEPTPASRKQRGA